MMRTNLKQRCHVSAKTIAFLAMPLFAFPSIAHAGMRSYTLTDAARMRLENMSFFAVILLICAGLVQLLWNYLRRDFPRLPPLTYLKSLLLVSLWGILFIFVLTMVAGARELMTPGAWEKQGTAYHLKNQPEAKAP
jgi:Na+/H+ antiporter NhaA